MLGKNPWMRSTTPLQDPASRNPRTKVPPQGQSQKRGLSPSGFQPCHPLGQARLWFDFAAHLGLRILLGLMSSGL